MVKLLEVFAAFLIRTLRGLAAFILEIIPLLSKSLLALSPFVLAVYSSYVIWGAWIATVVGLIAVATIVTGLTWAARHKIEDTNLSLALFLGILVFDALLLSALHFQANWRNELLPLAHKEESSFKDPRKEQVFVRQLKDSVLENRVQTDDFLHALNELKEMGSFPAVPIETVTKALRICAKKVNGDYSWVPENRKVCLASIDFLVRVKAKAACEDLYELQTDRGWIYSHVKEASEQICH